MAAARRKKRPPWHLALSLALSAAVLLAGCLLVDGLTAPVVGRSLLWPLLRLLLFISLGLVAGQLIEAAGGTRYLAVLARPLFRFSNLGDRCGAAFMAAFFSGTTANAMLREFHSEKTIGRRQLFMANLLNHFPAYFLHLPTTFFIVIPLTGMAGGHYFALTFLALVLRCTLVALYGYLHPPPEVVAPESPAATASPPGGHRRNGILAGIRARFPARLMNIMLFVVPIYVIIFVLNQAGLFSALRDGLARFVVTGFVPMESLSIVIISFVAEFTSGFAAAGALMDAGVLTVKQTALALLAGNVIAFPVRALRHQLPRYMGIFSPRTGLQLLLLGQGLRVVSILLVGAAYYFLW